MTNMLNSTETTLFPTPFTNSPIIAMLDVKAMHGIVANGSCSDMTAFSKSFIPVRSSILLKNAIQNVGTIAINRVKSTLFQRAHCKFKKPYQIRVMNEKSLAHIKWG
jgi:hypothetical protein